MKAKLMLENLVKISLGVGPCLVSLFVLGKDAFDFTSSSLDVL